MNKVTEIESICKKYGIINYTINKDESIDVDGGVNLGYKDLKNLPLNFNRVTGTFDCSYNQLTSLKGCPKEVGGHFWFAINPLPKLIMDNLIYYEGIIKWQDDYFIWRKDGSLDEFRFNDMMIDIKNDYEITLLFP